MRDKPESDRDRSGNSAQTAMGATVSSALLCRRRTESLRVLIFGLDAAGKTSVLYRLKLGQLVTTIPTIGFNVETVELDDRVSLTVWDVGGRDKIRALYRHYFSGSHGLMYIIDSNDRERLSETIEELRRLEESLTSEGLPDIPIAILCNKSDLNAETAALTLAELQKLLTDEESLKKKLPGLRNRPCSCFLVSAATGKGLTEAVNWLVTAALHEAPAVSSVNLSDSAEKSIVDNKDETAVKENNGWSGLYHFMKSALLR